MTIEAYLTLAVAIILLLALAFRVAAVDLLALTCLTALVAIGELTGSSKLPTAADAVAGFGNPGLVTIGLLFAVVAGLEMTGGTELGTNWLLRRARTLRSALGRLLAPIAVLSAFLNNTPVVAAMIPVVSDLSKRVSSPSSRLLLPLSYATVLGGTATLMGTSTNLIVAGMYQETFAGRNDVASLGFFAPAIVGVPAAIIGVIYMWLMAERLIPDRQAAVSAADDPRRYTAEVEIQVGGPLEGRTIEQAGLRNLPGLYIAEIQRSDGTIAAAKPREKLFGGDVLILVGNLESVVDLRKTRGLVPPDDQPRKLQVPAWKRTLVEAVVSPRCSLLGKTIRGGQFRSHYNAAVVAMARGDKQLSGKLGDVRLEVGDVLLLEASPSFLHRRSESRDFFLVSRVDRGNVRRPERAPIAIGVLLAMVVAVVVFGVELLAAAMIAAVAMIGLRCCTTTEARRSIDWSVLIVIGSTLGIGRAMETSGAAASVAGGLVTLAGNHPMAVFAMVYLATMLCTELITNNAAAALMFPIAITTASSVGIDPAAMAITVMIAASSSFLTPFGYQTNTMVYTVGGYRAVDYVRFGLPLTLIVFATTMTVMALFYL